MNDKELNDILGLVRVNYKNFYKNETLHDQKLLLKTWKYQFMNIPKDIMFQVLMQYMATEPSFPPSIAHLNKLLYQMTNEEIIGAEESFENVMVLVKRHGSDSQGFKMAYEAFSDVERLIIQQGYYRELGQSADPISVLKGQYCRMYNNKKETVIHDKRLALPTTDVLKLLSDRKLLEG